MIDFNPDGSIKLPGHMIKKQEQDKNKLKTQRCIKIRREMVNFTAPKKCVLQITLSDIMTDYRFVNTIYNYFTEKASVPTKLKKIDENNFEVEIGTDFRRCTDCCSLIYKYREFLDGNLIEEKGSCQFEGQKRNFCYEDQFD